MKKLIAVLTCCLLIGVSGSATLARTGTTGEAGAYYSILAGGATLSPASVSFPYAGVGILLSAIGLTVTVCIRDVVDAGQIGRLNRTARHTRLMANTKLGQAA